MHTQRKRSKLSLNGPREEVPGSSAAVKEGNNGTNLFLSVKTL